MKTVVICTFLFGLVAASTLSRFRRAFLKCHNDYREKHSVPNLTLSPTVSSAAQNWANYLAANGLFEHSSSSYGENLHNEYSSEGVPSPEILAKSACDNWYSEIQYYNFSDPGYVSEAGHFTAMVWKSSTELGGGLATAGNDVYIVANYNPAGNIDAASDFSENVLEPQ